MIIYPLLGLILFDAPWDDKVDINLNNFITKLHSTLVASDVDG